MKPDLDESLLSQFHAPIFDGAKGEEAARAMPVSDAGFRSLEGMLGGPMEVRTFLRIAIAIASALGRVHQDRLVHKDIKPANILVNPDSGEVRFTGFGLSSRMARERPQPRPPESIAGTLAYMAPEQTGRMNRSIDSRSDLYSLGVTLYQTLTGSLPFTATDPLEWVHCHIARKPVPPSERLETVPAPVSAIIMRLLVKTPEDRYQTAGGVGHDLRRCLAAWEVGRRIDDFPLGDHDTPDWLLIPEKLYGRQREVETLLASFNRIVNGGAPELVLVSGHSGIGKSAVVNELHKALVPRRGLFASGKFDQYKRDIPYSTLAQAFQGLIRGLLAKSEADLAAWRNAFREALGPNGRLMIDLVPELTLIIGEQPPVAELPVQQAQGRFHLVFRRFIGVFARPEHPLALFLDDLQWLDSATLDLLENLLTQPGRERLLVIGAYRDNDVDATHPLTRKLDAIRNAGAPVQEVRLAPLAREVVEQLIADTLHGEPARCAPLSQLVHEKTAGNPFFLIQFLRALAEEELLQFEHDRERWSWDLDRIRTKGYTDNVADLVVGKLSHLPVEVQNALRRLACLGASADVTTLSLVLGTSVEQVHADLWDAVRQEFVERSAGAYRFIHDRVQEAAYSLIPEDRRAEAHLRIGRLLVAHTPLEKREEAIFDIVNQLNRGAALITAQGEREQLAELNLVAGKRAKASTAYAAAQTYITAGWALLPEDRWEHCYALAFSLELHLAECEFLIGALAAAEDRLAMLSSRAGRLVDFAAVTCLRSSLYTTLDRSDRAVEICLDYLRQVGIQWSARPTSDEVRQEYERIWQQIGGRSIEELADLPLMTDPECRATLDVLAAVLMPARITDDNLVCLTVSRMANLSLEHGTSDGSCIAYVWVGSMIAGPRFGDYQAAFQFGHLGYDLVEQRGLTRFQAMTYMSFGNSLLPWTRHVRTARDPLRRAFEAANQSGDLNLAASCCSQLNTNLIAAGDPLDEVQGEAERGLAFAQKMRFGIIIDVITGQLELIRTLRGLTPTFGSFDEEGFDEHLFERHLANNPVLALAEDRYWIRKLQARFFAGSYASAIEAAANAERLLWTSRTVFEGAEYHFYAALARAAVCTAASAAEQAQHLEALAADYRLLQEWADNCPENFANRAALVAAEIARLEGRELDAERLYEKAIRSARANGFIHNEALANELAARFYAARGFDDIAHLYLRRARHCYARWGADGKVRQLDERYPRLREEEPAPDSRATIGEPVERLELATVLKVSQAVSGEIVLEKLVDTVLRTAIEHAGAERGLLLLSRGSELLVRAKGETRDNSVTVRLCESPVSATELPESVVRYAARTREAVILADASAQDPYATDEYIRATGARSVLCLPLVKQGALVALLYLENRLASSVFTPSRIALLEVLASQAAISLENSGLYRKLQQGEAEIRRLVDANVVGVMIWELEGRILEANDAFLRTVGYERADLVSGRLRWTDLTPAEWRERDERAIAELNSTGTFQPFEKEYFRKDGSRVPMLIGGAAFDEEHKRGVAFVVDLTDRKRAEEELRQSEAYLAEAQKLSQTGSWAWSPDQDIRYWSEECYRVLSFDPQDGLPRFEEFVQRIHPDDQPGFRELTQTAIREKAQWEADYRIVHPDGPVRDVHVVGHPVLSTSGHLVEFVGTVIDVTERKRAEEELRRSEMELRQMLDLTPQLVAVLGTRRERLYANRMTLAYLGVSLDDWREATVGSDIHPDDVDRLKTYADRASSNGLAYELEVRLRNRDGSYRWFLARYNPLRDERGQVIRWYVACTDIEDRKRAEERLQQENVALREEIDKTSMFEEIVGASPALIAVLSRVSKVAATDSTVLITGETGTGKELVARAIHKQSRRSSRAFVAVNCAAIPRELIASELFGHEKGAFTGATQRRLGRFELADGGTIFLDEVGELLPDTQVALLRVLQEREFERVGSTQPIQVDVRVIAATNRDLNAAAANGTFREDLFYRLNVFPLEMPALRERKEDIPVLVEYFIDRYARKAGKSLRRVNRRTLDRLQSYPWPGNVRELQNVVERSVILCETDEFTVDESWLSAGHAIESRLTLSSSLAVHEKAIIEEALRASGGQVFGPSGAAALLGMPRSTLESKIRTLGINKNRFRPPPARD